MVRPGWLVWVGWLAGASGCAEPTTTMLVPPPDQPLAFELTVDDFEPPERPEHEPAPVVFIDGVARTSLEVAYSTNAQAREAIHVVELRHGDAIVKTRTLDLMAHNCLDGVGIASSYRVKLCAYQSGDLRYGSDLAHGDGVCVGEGLCANECTNAYCLPGTHCSSRRTSLDPLASHLSCVPIGPKRQGEACTLIADPAGAYDDCGEQLLCVAGTCTAVCYRQHAEGELPFLPGHAPELRLCP